MLISNWRVMVLATLMPRNLYTRVLSLLLQDMKPKIPPSVLFISIPSSMMEKLHSPMSLCGELLLL